MKTLSVFVGALALVGMSFAQLAEAPAEIKALDWMVGNWEGKGTFSAQGQTVDVIVVWSVKKDGPFLRLETKQTLLGMDMTESAFIHWDSKKKEYVVTSYSNFAVTPRIERGSLKDGVLTTICEPWEVAGTVTVGRSTMKLVTKDEIEFMIDMKEGDTWTEASKMKMTRKSVW